MFGGKLAAQKKREFESIHEPTSTTPNTTGSIEQHHEKSASSKLDYRVQQLMYGGPVQRAIKADVLSLRTEFRKDLSTRRVTTNNTHGMSVRNTTIPGRAFAVFKETFQRTKFGIIHTRCCPPRCDKEAYIQMIYSTLLDLVYCGVRDNLLSDNTLNTMENIDGWFVDVIFAVFALYTIHETNPLPRVPLTPELLQKDSRDLSESEIKRLLSTMSMGASYEQGGRRAYRRYFCAPIRISMDQYFSLFQVREMAFVVMDSMMDMESSLGPTISDLALDGISVIDRLKDSLLFCEYAGPSSLEGLIGSEEYYHSIYLNEKNSLFGEATTKDLTCILDHHLVHENPGVVDDDVLSSITSFEQSIATHQKNYDHTLGCISRFIASDKSTSRPSLKLMAVEKTLEDVLQRCQYQPRSNTSSLSETIQRALSGYSLENDDSEIIICTEEEQKNDESVLNAEVTQMAVKDGMDFSCPSSLSAAEKAGLQDACMKYMQKTSHRAVPCHDRDLKAAAAKTVSQRNAGHAWRHEDWLLDDEYADDYTEFENQSSDQEVEFTDGEMNDLHGMSALDNLLSLANKSSKRGDYMYSNSEDDVSAECPYSPQSSHSSDEASFDSNATGSGALALRTLLALPVVNVSQGRQSRKRSRNVTETFDETPSSPSTHKTGRKRKKVEIPKKPKTRKEMTSKASSSRPRRLVSNNRTQKRQQAKKQKTESDDSEQSFTSISQHDVSNSPEAGQSALQLLISKAAQKPAISHDDVSLDASSSSSRSESSCSSGDVGENALKSLLSKV